MKRRQFIKGSAIFGFAAVIPAYVREASGIITGKNTRSIHKILNTDRTNVGTLPILRAFAGDQLDYVSPYVLFDEFGPVEVKARSAPLRVDAHPHAGIIPTTYFLEGTGHHKDSLNYDFQIGKGDFMMFSSGRGAIHMEETGKKLFDDGGQYHGFQIWLNMPSKYKWIAPSTFVHKVDNMGYIENKLFTAKVILGELFGSKSSIELLSPAFYYHIHMKENCRMDIPTDPAHNAFMYVISGIVETEGQKSVSEKQVALYKRGESLISLYSRHPSEILILGGMPLDEPVYSYGPFVMNTEAEILRCIRDYQSGKMGNPDLVNAK
ncbi:MAG: pirin family protein [Bacteroidetes bacterium]|nr:MAG: pirin family protein [Bacteroidota bacterium]REK05705.1 MAG: pirin family protein [Bacteroidota bacterium]REK31989.1 MAG: pirin family protein [Bacteroidota bacterium]REK50053.1 MAG: pirin family protein [Bacteroidota bacterium]